MRLAVIAILALGVGGAAAPSSQVEYRLSPLFTGGALTAVQVTIDLRGDADGTTILELPGDYGGVSDHWRYVSNLTVSGARVRADGPARRVLTARPGAAIRVRYHVASGYAADPAEAEGNPYAGAAIRPDWFAALGEFVFATPQGRDAAPARFTWVGWPAAWRTVSDLDHPGLTVDRIVEATLLAGPSVVVRTRPLPGGTLRLATRGSWGFDLDTYADTMARVIGAQRAFWGDTRGAYTVTLNELAPSPGSRSMGGTGRGDGFAQYAGAKIEADALLRNIAHEHIHSWIPRRLGTLPDGDAGAGQFWLSEGFSDFYAARTLLRAGIWTPEQFVADFNRVLVELATSSARDAPNARIVKAFWTDREVEQLPYRRGSVFAALVDHELRARGGGLDAVIFAMRDAWVAAPPAAKPDLRTNFIAAMRRAGLDPRAMLARHIDAGVPVALSATLFGTCASIATISLATFDPGFDRDASAKAGVVAGVDPTGPAFAAGLRDGMRRIARVGGSEGDSRVPLSYRIADPGGERVVAWLPAGKASVAVAQVKLRADRPADCARRMSGGPGGR